MMAAYAHQFSYSYPSATQVGTADMLDLYALYEKSMHQKQVKLMPAFS